MVLHNQITCIRIQLTITIVQIDTQVVTLTISNIYVFTEFHYNAGFPSNNLSLCSRKLKPNNAVATYYLRTEWRLRGEGRRGDGGSPPAQNQTHCAMERIKPIISSLPRHNSHWCGNAPRFIFVSKVFHNLAGYSNNRCMDTVRVSLWQFTVAVLVASRDGRVH